MGVVAVVVAVVVVVVVVVAVVAVLIVVAVVVAVVVVFDHRIAQAWGDFNRHSRLLCSGRGFSKRFQLLYKVVVPALMYNIGACNLTQRRLQEIRVVVNQMMIRVMRLRLNDDEADEETYLSSSQFVLLLYRMGPSS